MWNELFANLFVAAAWLLFTRRHSFQFFGDTLRELFFAGSGIILLYGLVSPRTGLFYILAGTLILLVTRYFKLRPYSVVYLFALSTAIRFLPSDQHIGLYELFPVIVLFMAVSATLLMLFAGFEERYRYQVVPRAIKGVPFRLIMGGFLWILVTYIIAEIRL